MSSSAVDFRSDAVTLPGEEMRRAMASARVGYDDFGEDPTVNLLEERSAALLGMEAALFVHSGTMGNLLAILSQSECGQAVCAGLHSHIYDHEYPGVQRFCGVGLRPIPEVVEQGRLRWDVGTLKQMLSEPIQSRPTVLCLEQTINRLGGVVMPLAHMAKITVMARERGLAVHLDGARLFNAALALGANVAALTRHADTVMTVFTKCLGAPHGAVLAGPKSVIDAARKQRHYMGGGMKQGGIAAAACLVALDQASDVSADHRRARYLAEALAGFTGLGVSVDNTVSNMVLVDVRPLGIDHPEALAQLQMTGILASRAMPGILRLVLHRDITDEGVEQAIATFETLTAMTSARAG